MGTVAEVVFLVHGIEARDEHRILARLEFFRQLAAPSGLLPAIEEEGFGAGLAKPVLEGIGELAERRADA